MIWLSVPIALVEPMGYSALLVLEVARSRLPELPKSRLFSKAAVERGSPVATVMLPF